MEDAAMIAALSTQVFLDTYATEGIRPDLAREAFNTYSEGAFRVRLAEPGRRFLLAMRDDALVGFAEVICSNLASPIESWTGAELARLYVQPQAQGTGLGRELLRESEAHAQGAGIPALWLTAWDGNVNALAFYARMNYADIGATTYSFEGNTYGNRVFAKALTS